MWDPDLLKRFSQERVNLDTLWTPDELEQLLGQGLGQGKTSDDAVVTPPETDITRGQLFSLGRHRLLCGDATCGQDVARLLGDTSPSLMVTDPPYGVDYDPAWRVAQQPSARTAVGRVANDDRVDWSAAYMLFPGNVAYVWHAGVFAHRVAASIESCDFTIRAQIVWTKQTLVFSRGHYHWQHEPCWYAVRQGQSANWRGSRTQTTVWSVPNLNPLGGDRDGDNAATGHSTQKPVRLFEIPILNHTLQGDAIYEPFSGSGTALIAAEKTGRCCLAMELDPRYVQAAIDRWQAYTGERAVLAAEGGAR